MRKIIVGCLISWGLVMGSVHAATLDCSTATNINVPIGECQALLDLYDSTNGPSWTSAGGWDTDSNVCTWYGIACTNIAGQDRVTSISLGSNNLNGALPSSLSSLDQINYFDINSNQISGVLPDSWSSWVNIIIFSARNNQIGGVLPDSWSSWVNITRFSAQNNQISGVLPDAWASWVNINFFQINNNQILGTLPNAWSSWTNITRFSTAGNQIDGVLPNVRGSWVSIESFYVDGNQIKGSLPDSWNSWTNIANFYVNFNQLNGTVPSSWITNRQNIGGQYIKLDHNCLSTDSYGGDQIRIDTNTRYNPQNDCGSRDLSITKTLLQPLTLYPGDLVGYSLYYENNGTDSASNVIITDIPGNGMSIISASVSYSAQTITGAYGVPGDSCFDDMTNNTIGYYTDALNQRAVNVYGAPNFQTVLENELGWTGGANRGYRFGIDTMNIFGSSFQDFLLSNLGIDITTIDSSCGSPDQFGYIFNLGTIGAGVTGEIFLTGQVTMTGFTLGQTGIMNTAEISTSSSEISLSNNRSSVISPLTGITTSSTGGSSSSSGSSGITIIPIPMGFGGGFGGHIPTPSTDKSHDSAPVETTQEFIEDNFSCPYTDGDFESYITTMRDIPKTGAKREAIVQLLKKCVVHGKRGEGKLYGTYNRITYGEVYKIIVRSLGLPFNEDLAGHRALPYKAAARKAKLLQGSDTSHSLDDIADTKDIIVLLTNMVKYNGGSIDSLSLDSIRTPYILRGKFALLVTSLLKK